MKVLRGNNRSWCFHIAVIMTCACLLWNGWSCDKDIGSEALCFTSVQPQLPSPSCLRRGGYYLLTPQGRLMLGMKNNRFLDCPVMEDTIPTQGWAIFLFTTTNHLISFHLMNNTDLRTISGSGHQHSMETRKMIRESNLLYLTIWILLNKPRKL